ncbi:MAG TPA: SRPBCC family protein [Rhizobacter sp.]
MPLLLGAGLGALLMYAASTRPRPRPRVVPTLPSLDEASALATRGARSATVYVRQHPGAAVGVLAGVAGVALTVLAARNATPLREKLKHLASGDAIHVSKSVEIAATPEEVFDVWAEVENFPRFMTMVEEVRPLGGDRSHWKVKGPAGLRVEWDSAITERERGRLLAWRSEAESAVEHAGRVELQPSSTGTRATVSMTYRPPGGRLGHAMASLFGRNPQQELDHDLECMRRYVESRGTGQGAERQGLRAVGETSTPASAAAGSTP